MATQLCGYFLSDRIPLRIARRHGDWHPEYRLFNVFLVVIASPLGIGIFGAGLQYAYPFVRYSQLSLIAPGTIYTTWFLLWACFS